MKRISLFTFLVCFSALVTATNNLFSTFRIKQLTTQNGLPNNDVQYVYQDKEGFIWISTRGGLFLYNGYNVNAYKSNFRTPYLLSDNNVLCTVEDNHQQLWIGTYNGLNVLDKRTNQISHINQAVFTGNPISRILIHQEELWLATEKGLYKYIAAQDTAILINETNTKGVFNRYTIKSLYKDSRGHIWIGTWSNGLFRYDPETNDFFHYRKMNERNSAHVVFEDSYHRIWVGTWDCGLHLLETPYDPNTAWKTFTHNPRQSSSISDNIIYDISEDKQTHTLWIGTRSGLSIMNLEDNFSFKNYYPNTADFITGNEINAIMRDHEGRMWLGLLGGGVSSVSTGKSEFQANRLPEIKERLLTNSVRAIFLDDEDNLWLGIGTYGLVMKEKKTGKWYHHSQMPDFSLYNIPTVLCITQSKKTGKILIGTYDGGVYEYDKKAPSGKRVAHFYPGNADFMPSSCVYAIQEDEQGNTWFGTRFGLGMRMPNGQGTTFKEMRVDKFSMAELLIQDIIIDSVQDIWLATGNNGVVRLIQQTETDTKSFKALSYSLDKGSLNTMSSTCIYIDAKNRLWVGSEGGGLSYYNAQQDNFVSIHQMLNLQSDGVFSILGDKKANLWIGTNAGILHLSVPDNIKQTSYRLFTTADGINDNVFNKKAACSAHTGELFFGSHRGYTSFLPENIQIPIELSKMIITDVKIQNKSWQSYNDDIRESISKFTPSVSKAITLSHHLNNFTVEFAALDYVDPTRNIYAYKLEGFDTKWQYTDITRRFAHYNNLPYGNYCLLLKTTNSTSHWDSVPALKMNITVLPPFWLTWWAFVIYCLIILAISLFLFNILRNRMLLRNEIHLRETDKIRSDELNHAKLQFFTNITHELLTPLTIISATLDELKISAPQNIEHYQLMTSNIKRLMRLIQQILEFRKAETGNLKLKVAQGDLKVFLQNSINGFMPLMKKKNITFTLDTPLTNLMAYFDPDKIDKVLYNLFSNASKYNKEDGDVKVSLKYDEDAGAAIILVKDNGQGISEEAQKNLFKRFYEGDYRKYHTIGTGIGLSLCRDLMQLHKGSISVESELNKGTCFQITFPIERDAYTETEIDDSIVVTEAPIAQSEIASIDIDYEINEGEGSKEFSLLLVEDNDELLLMMNRLLNAEYMVYTATNGKEALDVVSREYIDLIVSDVMMPEMDGIELCKEIKGNLDTSHIPVILLTAKNTQQDRVEAYDSGADAFISKPFNLSLLHSRITNLLKARQRVNKDFKKQLVFEAKELNYTSIDEDFLRKAIECVHAHLDDPEFDHMQFVAEMGTSKSTLFRKLKSLTGLSSSSFIRNIRLKTACQIIEEKQRIRVSELAYAVGFNDPKYFSSCFKKEFGMQPSEYMERFLPNEDGLELEE